MVERIEAFKTSDGKTWEDEGKAVEHEARTKLGNFIKNPALVNEIMSSALAVYESLDPLIQWINRPRVGAEVQ